MEGDRAARQGRGAPLSGEELSRACRHFRRHEGEVRHPYLDSRGLATVGVGFLLPDEESFLAVPFRLGQEGPAAGVSAKRAGYRTLLASADEQRRRPRPAAFWRDATPLCAPGPWVEARLRLELEARAERIARALPPGGWQGLSPSRRLLLLDVHYAAGSLRGFPALVRAALEGDGEAMAVEALYRSGRYGSGPHQGLPRRNWARVAANWALALDGGEGGSGEAAAAAAVCRHFAGGPEEPLLPAWLKRAAGEAEEAGVMERQRAG